MVKSPQSVRGGHVLTSSPRDGARSLYYPDSINDIDLSKWNLRRKSLEEGEGGFALLRKERPIAFFEKSEASVPIVGGKLLGIEPACRCALRQPESPDILLSLWHYHPRCSARSAGSFRLHDWDNPGINDLAAPCHKPLLHVTDGKSKTPCEGRRGRGLIVLLNGASETVSMPLPRCSDSNHLRHVESPGETATFVFEQANVILGGIDPEYGTEDPVERFAVVM